MPKIFLTHTPDALAQYFGDRALTELRKIVEVRCNEGGKLLTTDALIEAAENCQIILSDRNTPGPGAVFDRLPDLVVFMRCAVDIRTIDVEKASSNGVLVTNASPGFIDAVCELTLGMMVDLARNVTRHTNAYRAGEVPEVVMGTQLSGSTLGILGYGQIGRPLADLGLALGMKVIVGDPYKKPDDPRVEHLDQQDILARADFVVCLVVATDETENLMDEAAFKAMKPSAFFINVSRGNLVNEGALETALVQGRIAGAAMDVGRAPDQMPSPNLASLPNVIATPHIGGLTPTAIESQSLETVEQVRALVSGKLPHNAINPEHASRLKRLTGRT